MKKFIYISDGPYFASHQKAPRGFGVWAFAINGKTHFAPISMKFAEARKWACDKARELGATRVDVLP